MSEAAVIDTCNASEGIPREIAAIEACGLVKSYGGRRVLKGIDLRVTRGAVLALLGPNGAGKTTTVRILATLTAPDGGWAKVAGHDVRSERRQVRRLVSLTGQYAALDELQSGRENLQMVARLRELSARHARSVADELLIRFDLQEAADRHVGSYSGGMRRRLDLAAGLIGEPEVLFLDEPTTGLDPRGRHVVWEILSELAAEGMTILLTTQYLEEADRLADEIAVIDAGCIVAEGTAAQLKSQVGGQRLDVRAADEQAFERLANSVGARAVDSDRTQLTLGIPSAEDAGSIRALLDQLDPAGDMIASFDLRRASLDDVFMALTGHRTGSAA
jgi:ABC-2 type transport system ATP-binding protein